MIDGYIDTYYEIYKKIFLKIYGANIDLFLCGGASDDKNTSKRDELRDYLKKNSSFSILYPEDLFVEMLNRKKYDLLTLENFLAKNSSYIVIVTESPGSFAELGAFTNNEDIIKKVYVLQHTKYKNTKSFINQGPIELVKSKNKDRVLYYNDASFSKTASDLSRKIRLNWIFSQNLFERMKNIDLITGQYNFIVLLLYFFKSLDVRDLQQGIKHIYNAKNFEEQDFEIVYRSAIVRLYKNGLIKKEKNEFGKSVYLLTDKGFDYSRMLLGNVFIRNRTKEINKIRMNIMKKDLYNH